MTRPHRPCCTLAVATIACGAAVLLAPVGASAQIPDPRLSGLSQLGVKQGASAKVQVRGKDLETGTALLFTHPGITAKPFEPAPPPEAVAPETKPDPKADPKAKTEAKPAPKAAMKAPAPPKVDRTQWVVTVAKDVPVGHYEVRVATEDGLSNPFPLQVSDLDEVVETEPNDRPEQATALKLDTAVSGASDKTADVDHFKVVLPAGKRVVIECAGERLDSEFSPAVELVDPAGRVVAESANYAGRHALIDHTAPAAGEYVIRVRDFIYAGAAAAFHYRLVVSTRPQIEFTVPAAVKPGTEAKVTLYGRNLPGGVPDDKVKINGRALERLVVPIAAPVLPAGTSPRLTDAAVRLPPEAVTLDAFEYRVRGPALMSEPVLIGLARDPVVAEADADHASVAAAQVLAVPADVTGRFGRRGETDHYRFSAKKGEVRRIEVFAARIGSTIDPVVLIGRIAAAPAADGKPAVTWLQDNVDDDATPFGDGAQGRSAKFEARSEDPRILWTAPDDADYVVQVQDRYGAVRAGARAFYRLVISAPEPHFRLAVIHPSDGPAGGVSIGKGGRSAFQVLVGRYDGFEGTVQVTVDGLPAGITADPVYLGPGVRVAPLVISAKADAADWAGLINVTGKAVIDGKTVTRQAAGGVMISGNPNNNQSPRYGRISRDIAAAVRGKANFTLTVEPAEVLLVPGGKADVKVRVTRPEGFTDTVALTGYDQAQTPSQNNNQAKGVGNIAKGASDATVSVGLPKGATYGKYSYAVLGQGSIVPPAGKDAKNKKASKVFEPSNVIVLRVEAPLEIKPVSLAGKLDPGGTIEVPVEIVRLAGVTEEVTLTLTGMPARTFTAAPVTIAKGATTGKLVIKSDPRPVAAKVGSGLVLTAAVTTQGQALKVVGAVSGEVEVVPPAPEAKADPKAKKK